MSRTFFCTLLFCRSEFRCVEAVFLSDSFKNRKRSVAIKLYRRYLKLTYGEIEKIFNLKGPRISQIMQNEVDVSPDMLEYIDLALTK